MQNDFYLTPNFKLSELTITNHKKYQELNLKEAQAIIGKMYFLAGFAEAIREIIGKPLLVSSGFRCPELNKAINGSIFSQHMLAEAIDISCKTLQPKTLFDRIRKSGLKYEQLILEQNKDGSKKWVHVSIGSRKQCLSYDGIKYTEMK